MKNDATLPIKVPKVRQFKCDHILHFMLELNMSDCYRSGAELSDFHSVVIFGILEKVREHNLPVATYGSLLLLPTSRKSFEICKCSLEMFIRYKMKALQRLQNRAFDMIDSSRLKGSWERRSLNVNQLMNFDRSLMTYKIVNNLCPEMLQNTFQERSSHCKI